MHLKLSMRLSKHESYFENGMSLVVTYFAIKGEFVTSYFL